MNIPIPAIMLNRRWRKWLTEHCPKHQILSDDEVVHIRNLLALPEQKWGSGLSFEIENVEAEAMASCVIDVFLGLAISQIVVWLGDYRYPVIARISVPEDLRVIFSEESLRDNGVSFTVEHAIGRVLIDLPLSGEPGEFSCSAAGLFEDAIKRIAQLCPGGVLFRGN